MLTHFFIISHSEKYVLSIKYSHSIVTGESILPKWLDLRTHVSISSQLLSHNFCVIRLQFRVK